jgi:hypothetical protein
MAKHLPRVCLSIARLTRRPRKGQIKCQEILLDSGAFSELALHGRYRDDVDAYARNLEMAYKLAPTIIAAVGQDYMCEPFILAKTGLTIADHQWLTIDRYDRLLEKGPPMPILPVLQGFAPRALRLRARRSPLDAGAHVAWQQLFDVDGAGGVVPDRQRGGQRGVDIAVADTGDVRPGQAHGVGDLDIDNVVLGHPFNQGHGCGLFGCGVLQALR